MTTLTVEATRPANGKVAVPPHCGSGLEAPAQAVLSAAQAGRFILQDFCPLAESLEHRPRAPGTHLHLGYALQASGRLDEAVAAWEEALRLAPGDPEAMEALGRVQPVTTH